MDKIVILSIDGAVVFPEAERNVINGETYFQLPKLNRDYKKFTLIRGFPFVSKDGEKWCMAAQVLYEKIHYPASVFADLFKSMCKKIGVNHVG